MTLCLPITMPPSNICDACTYQVPQGVFACHGWSPHILNRLKNTDNCQGEDARIGFPHELQVHGSKLLSVGERCTHLFRYIHVMHFGSNEEKNLNTPRRSMSISVSMLVWSTGLSAQPEIVIMSVQENSFTDDNPLKESKWETNLFAAFK